MIKLDDAHYRLTEARVEFASAREKVIDAQLTDMKKQLHELPALPPAADQDAQDTTQSRKLRIQEKIEERQQLLDKAWPELPS